MNTNFITDWKYRCPRCGQEQSDVARMKRHYARVKPCMGVYNPETKKYEGQPIEDIPWKVLQDGIGVVSRKSKVAEKKAKEAKLKAEQERLANMTWRNCPLLYYEDRVDGLCLVETLWEIFKNTFLDTGFVKEIKLFKYNDHRQIVERFNMLISNLVHKIKKENRQCEILYSFPDHIQYRRWIRKLLWEKIEYHTNIKHNINNEELDHLPFFIKYNYILDLFPVPFKKHSSKNYPREGIVFSRRTLYIHNKITGEVIGHYCYDPEDWDCGKGWIRCRHWGGCPAALKDEEYLYKKIDYS